MKTLNSHGRKDQILINIKIDDFARAYFKIMRKRLGESYVLHQYIVGNKLKFTGSIFRFAWNGWNLFNPISSGEVEFTAENGNSFIRHQINFNETLTIMFIFHIIPLFTLKFEPGWSLFVFLCIWFFYAIIYLVTVFRFNSFISETLIDVNKNARYELLLDDEAIG